MTAFDAEQYRRERLRRLERHNESLEAERDRLVRLLAGALLVAVGQTRCTVRGLLDLLEELDAAGVRFGDLPDPETHQESTARPGAQPELVGSGPGGAA